MQSDRELLMLAAKAAGYNVDPRASFMTWRDSERLAPLNPQGGHTLWSSLADDGDCARLEAACEIDVGWMADLVICIVVDRNNIAHEFHENFERHGGDKNKARRYASTRAAASLAQAAQGVMG